MKSDDIDRMIKMRRATRDEKIVNPGVYEVPVHASDISQEPVDETEKDRHEPVAWLDNGLGVFYWASEFNNRPVPPGFEPLYAAQPRTWSAVTDDALIEEVRYRGFTIRDAQISPKREWIGLDHDQMRNTPIEFNRGAMWAERYLKERNYK